MRYIRIAVGAAAPTVVRLKEIERSLIGKSIGELAKYSDAVSALYADAIRPIDDQRSTAAYRKTVALGLIGRFIENLEQQ
jgi:CO/xanthine dehydrogenase FAD-binding subunit